MLWHEQVIFESKGDSLFTSAEFSIRTRVSGPESPADWTPAYKSIVLSMIKLKTYIHAYIHTYIHTNKFIQTYIYAWMHACTHARTHACIHAYIHTYHEWYLNILRNNYWEALSWRWWYTRIYTNPICVMLSLHRIGTSLGPIYELKNSGFLGLVSSHSTFIIKSKANVYMDVGERLTYERINQRYILGQVIRVTCGRTTTDLRARDSRSPFVSLSA